MQTLSHSNAVPIKPGRNISVIAAVGLLHVVLVYALLVFVDIVPAPMPPPWINTHFIDHTKTAPPPPPPNLPVTLAHPETGTVIEPKIPIDPGAQANPGNTWNGADTGAQSGPVLVAATALASTHTIPAYPALDRRLGHEGKVRLKLLIDANGAVTDAVVERSSGYDSLDAAAVAWVKAHWRYQPATQDGKAIAASSEADVTFRLTQG